MKLEKYYEDLTALHIGTQPVRAYYIPYERAAGAVQGVREESRRFLSLNGLWDFAYYDCPQDYAAEPLFPQNYASIPVPSVWQMHGYDKHQYTNTRYPFPYDPPYVPTQNPCGVYRRRFPLEKAEGRRYYLNFEGVDSCYYVYVNGTFTGFSQVSHSTSEFDITSFLCSGENELVVIVLKWCAGSYMEDQDKLRMSGIFRDVYILERPQEHLSDFTIRTQLDEESGAATVELEMEYHGEAFPVRCVLFSPSGEELKALTAQGRAVFQIPDAELWNAESPLQYTLLMQCPDECIAQRFGVRRIGIRDGVLHLNGRRLRFKGVNRHDSDPVTGYTVSREQALTDLTCMKRHNINAIRTSHYPNAPWFAPLCAELGFYLIEEADIEMHGVIELYNDKEGVDNDFNALARDPRFAAAIMDRVQRCVIRDKNCCAVLIWSLGNESGYGENFAEAARWIHQYDASRLTHYEGSIYKKDDEDYSDLSEIDVFSRMYPRFEEIHDYFAGSGVKKPYVMCEYIHAMGNGPGDIEGYEQLMDRYPGMCGGFAWEWCDHAVYMGKTAEGKPMYFYGGDFGEYPHDGNFCVDGLVFPDRTPHTGLLEYKNVLRPARAYLETCEDGVGIRITNRLGFTNLQDAVTAEYTLTCNGDPVESGSLPALDIAPGESGKIHLPLAFPKSGKCCLNIQYRQKTGTPLVDAGHILGMDQLILREARVQPAPPACTGRVEIGEDEKAITVSSPRMRVVFDKLAGNFQSLHAGNRCLITKPAEYNIWRAPADNDRNIRERWEEAGYNRAQVRVYETHASLDGDCAVITCRFSLAAVYRQRILDVQAQYKIDANGCIKAQLHAVRNTDLPFLPRFGVRLMLPKAFGHAQYWGYGPVESYADKHQASCFGHFHTTAHQSHVDYLRPQENGSHWGCDAVTVGSAAGDGICVTAREPMSFTLSPYTQEELCAKAHPYELRESDDTVLCLDYAQSGLGSNSCGPDLAKEYRLDAAAFDFGFSLWPLIQNQ